MNELPGIVKDLALILISAGIITYIFKIIKQPAVLGYILAGFILSPYFPWYFSVQDHHSIEVWSEIGVIFLLFALGLEFSFKKLVNVGASAFLTATSVLITMFSLGFLVGKLLGWGDMDCLFLASMLPMSSTSIIIKLFDDNNLKNHKFASIVFGTLVVEDLFAVLMMVLLSTIAVSKSVSGEELIFCIAKLLFFLVLWFVVGIYLLPSFFKHARKWLNDENLLVISIGLCLLMVILATGVGFSSALGAFVMGSILAETVEGAHIEKLIKSIKDLFGAVFFVSVGMMVDPHIIVEYIVPILVISLVVVIFQPLSSGFGVLMSGQNLKTAIQAGFSLSQVGEFAFILATLGISLNVISPEIYPIIVSVSILTTLISSYMIKWAVPFYDLIYPKIPVNVRTFLDEFSISSSSLNTDNNWTKLRNRTILRMVIYSVIIIAIILLFNLFLYPFIDKFTGNFSPIVRFVVTSCAIIPCIMSMVNINPEYHDIYVKLREDVKFNRGKLLFIMILKSFLSSLYMMFVVESCFDTSLLVNILVFMGTMALIYFLPNKHGFSLSKAETQFLVNFHAKENEENRKVPLKKHIANKLSGKDIQMNNVEISSTSKYVGVTLAASQIKSKFGINIVKIIRGNKQINVPSANEIIFPGDILYYLGSEEQVTEFLIDLDSNQTLEQEEVIEEIFLKSFVVNDESELVSVSIRECGIRDKTGCMVVGIERHSESYMNPNIDMAFEVGDLVWVVGDKYQINKLVEEKIWAIKVK